MLGIQQDEVLVPCRRVPCIQQFQADQIPPCVEMVAFSRSVLTVKVSAGGVVAGMEAVGETGAALPRRLADGTGVTPAGSRPPAVSTAGFGWLYFCQFSHSMKLENVKIKPGSGVEYP